MFRKKGVREASKRRHKEGGFHAGKAVMFGPFGAFGGGHVGCWSRFGSTATAMAGHWRNDDDLYKGDQRDGSISFHKCDLISLFENAFNDNNTHDIAPTRIFSNPVNNSCNNGDVRINDYAYDQSLYIGWWECHAIAEGGNICDAGHIHIDLNETAYSAGDALSLVCEEIGHSIGLGHRPESTGTTCMKGVWANRHLDTDHDRNVINANY